MSRQCCQQWNSLRRTDGNSCRFTPCSSCVYLQCKAFIPTLQRLCPLTPSVHLHTLTYSKHTHTHTYPFISLLSHQDTGEWRHVRHTLQQQRRWLNTFSFRKQAAEAAKAGESAGPMQQRDACGRSGGDGGGGGGGGDAIDIDALLLDANAAVASAAKCVTDCHKCTQRSRD